MEIAFVMYPGACFMGAGDGSKMQAVIWKEALEKKGHKVEMVSPWGAYDWKSFDIVHVFGFGLWNYDFIHWGSCVNRNFVFSPIIDTNTKMFAYRLATFFGCAKLRLFSQNYILRKLKQDVKRFYARTDFEANYLRKGYGIADEKISLIPLSYRMDAYDPSVKKESFCLFAGTMTQERKNVPNLIRAAKKYGFRLVLVGNTGNAASLAKLQSLIAGASNIEIKGFVTEDELIALYNRAKVFALPSLNEGVGLVALEAAIHGCNIVITDLGGPKEYYKPGLANLVNPYDIDDIGVAILKSLDDNSQQPALRNYLIENYSITHCVDMLIESYKRVLEAK
ncbi:glycosyltransferase family 4 protein [Phocaeicola sp.]